MLTNYKTFVVINPAASGNGVANVWRDVVSALRERMSEVDFAITEYTGHATQLTRQALKDGWEQIVALGGDGTINEVVNGFFYPLNRHIVLKDGFLDPLVPIKRPELIAPNAVLGLLPYGTGGDFRRNARLSTSLDENIDKLMGTYSKLIDVGEIAFVDRNDEIQSRLFLNIAGGGFSGEVVKIANSHWKALSRGATFKLAAALGWLNWTNPSLRIQIDDHEVRNEIAFNVAVANGECFGGGMKMAKGAHINDGFFDVIECNEFNRLDSFSLLFKIYEGKHFRMGKVRRTLAKRVKITPYNDEDRVFIDIDGEDLGRFPATFTMHDLVLNLKVGYHAPWVPTQ